MGVPNNDSVTLEQVSSPPGAESHPAEAHGSGLARMRRTQCGSQGVKQLRYSCTALNHGWQRDNIPATLPFLLCQGQRPLEDGHGNARTQINNNRYVWRHRRTLKEARDFQRNRVRIWGRDCCDNADDGRGGGLCSGVAEITRAAVQTRRPTGDRGICFCPSVQWSQTEACKDILHLMSRGFWKQTSETIMQTWKSTIIWLQSKVLFREKLLEKFFFFSLQASSNSYRVSFLVALVRLSCFAHFGLESGRCLWWRSKKKNKNKNQDNFFWHDLSTKVKRHEVMEKKQTWKLIAELQELLEVAVKL